MPTVRLWQLMKVIGTIQYREGMDWRAVTGRKGSIINCPNSCVHSCISSFATSALGLPVLAADVDYAHEVLNGYDGVVYTDVHDYEAWAKHIIAFSIEHKRYKPLPQERESDWGVFFDLIK